MDITTAKEKVRKLFAIADTNSGASPQEMETALRHAEALMRKHNIQMAEVLDSGKQIDFNWDSGFFAFGENGKVVQSNPIWFQWLGTGIARFTDTICRQTRLPGQGIGLSFYGEESDVAFALWLAGYLKDSIRRGTRDAKCGSKEGRETFRRSMAVALCHRMAKMREDREQSQKQAGTALVVVNQKIALRDQEFGGENYRKTRSSVVIHDENAATKAWHAAQKVTLSRVIGQSQTSGLLHSQGENA